MRYCLNRNRSGAICVGPSPHRFDRLLLPNPGWCLITFGVDFSNRLHAFSQARYLDSHGLYGGDQPRETVSWE